MATDAQLNATIRGRWQFRLCTMLLAVTGIATACVGLHYLGPANAAVLVLFLGPALLAAFAATLIGPAVVAHYIRKLFSDQAAGFFLAAVPAIVGLGSLFLVAHPAQSGNGE